MLLTRLRGRVIYLVAICLFIFVLSFLSFHNVQDDVLVAPVPIRKKSPVPHPIYKAPRNKTKPVIDNFPLAAKAVTSTDLPPIPSWNRPPDLHIPENTPLFIGFTRNWLLLQQTVVSYITAGWPAEDIYVVENTGTMNANEFGRLSIQNPFYLDHKRLTDVFGVNVLSTPTYLSFSQLQNFYLSYAIDKNWDYYFWGHMDVAALTMEDYEDPKTGSYTNFYGRTVQDLRRTLSPDYAVDADGRSGRWAIKFYAYDRLALVNRLAFEEVGGWDAQIPYYGTDCDMHERLFMAGFKQENARTGLIYDLGSSLDDLIVLYRRKPEADDNSWGSEDERASSTYHNLTRELDRLQTVKNSDDRGRNTWQSSQTGGLGEPYYRDPEGFEQAVLMTIESGRQIMAEKWGHRGCNLREMGLNLGDEWRVAHNWK